MILLQLMLRKIKKNLRKINNIYIKNTAKNVVDIQLNKGIVSFCFDDIQDSAVENGQKILEKYGFKGTFYVALGLENIENELGKHFNPAHLTTLIRTDNEIGCHTFLHIVPGADHAIFEKDVLKNRALFKQNFGIAFTNFSFVKGEITAHSKRFLSKYYDTLRGIASGFNTQKTDLHQLKANQIYSDKNNFLELQQLIATNAALGSWLIFYTHDVRNNPSAYGTTLGFFEQVVHEVSLSDNKVLTIAQAFEHITKGKSA